MVRQYSNLGKRRDQTACKPGSLPPAPDRIRGGRGGHSSGPSIAGRFSRPTRTARAGEGPAPLRRRVVPIRSCSKRGLPCRLRCRRRGALLPHPFTLAWRRSVRRFAFCGAIPGVAPGGRYPPPFRRGARTFLHPPKRTATARPSGPARNWARGAAGSSFRRWREGWRGPGAGSGGERPHQRRIGRSRPHGRLPVAVTGPDGRRRRCRGSDHDRPWRRKAD